VEALRLASKVESDAITIANAAFSRPLPARTSRARWTARRRRIAKLAKFAPNWELSAGFALKPRRAAESSLNAAE
jgi:hypothetical protein